LIKKTGRLKKHEAVGGWGGERKECRDEEKQCMEEMGGKEGKTGGVYLTDKETCGGSPGAIGEVREKKKYKKKEEGGGP